MTKPILIIVCWLMTAATYAQKISQRIEKAWQEFAADSQLRHAISSLYVINAKTGDVVFDRNSEIGLAPASTQKIITAVTAFELLGKDYRYRTDLAYDGKIDKGVLKGNLLIVGTGDPTLGSWRYASTNDTDILNAWVGALRQLKLKEI